MPDEMVGFVGLGIMGLPMAKNLLDAGYPVVGHNRSREPVDELVAYGLLGFDCRLVRREGALPDERRGRVVREHASGFRLVAQVLLAAVGPEGVREVQAVLVVEPKRHRDHVRGAVVGESEDAHSLVRHERPNLGVVHPGHACRVQFVDGHG